MTTQVGNSAGVHGKPGYIFEVLLMRGLYVGVPTSCTEYLPTGSYIHSHNMITSHWLQFTTLLSVSVQHSQVALWLHKLTHTKSLG